MGKTIEIIGDVNQNKPRTICPHCKRTILMHLTPWENDVSKVIQDKCPHCGGVIVSALLILSDADVKRLMGQVQAIIDMFKKSGANVVDPEQRGRILQP